MMYQFVVLVDLENERVIDVVSAENLHSKSCGKDYERDDPSEVVYVHSVTYLAPMIHTVTRSYR